MRIILLRHGKTAGNQQGRYVGRTDEPLCREGISELKERLGRGKYDFMAGADRIASSPMRRCLETAEILSAPFFGEKPELLQIPQFIETDFGEFEYKNYKELSGDTRYQSWIGSGGKMPFPGGEGREEVAARCREGFFLLLDMLGALQREKEGEITAVVIVHGGIIMSLMEQFCVSGLEYYDYRCQNGGGYICALTEKKRLRILQVIQ